jgi:hypothetical protein
MASSSHSDVRIVRLARAEGRPDAGHLPGVGAGRWVVWTVRTKERLHPAGAVRLPRRDPEMCQPSAAVSRGTSDAS